MYYCRAFIRLATAVFLKNWTNLASFSYIFVFSNTQYKIYTNTYAKKVHPVYGAEIQTHDLWIMSLLP